MSKPLKNILFSAIKKYKNKLLYFQKKLITMGIFCKNMSLKIQVNNNSIKTTKVLRILVVSKPFQSIALNETKK